MRLLRELGYQNVRHYPGGLTEWFEDAEPVPEELRRIGSLALEGRRRGPPGGILAIRLLDTLGNQSVGALFAGWVMLVVLSSLAYWMLGWSTRPALVSANGPIGTGLRGLLSAFYFSSIAAMRAEVAT